MDTSSIVIILILAVIVVLAVRALVKKGSTSCCNSGGKVKKVRVADSNPANYPHHKVAKVEGMVCLNCIHRVENAINALNGCYAKVDSDGKSTHIYSKSPLDDDFIRSAISEAGYTVTAVREA